MKPKNSTWSIEANYNSYGSEYDVEIGKGQPSRYVDYQNYSPGIKFGGGMSGTNKGGASQVKTPSQTVIKVTGHKKSSGGLKAHVDYISRDGGIEVETEQGDTFSGNERDQAFSEWVVDHEERMKQSRTNSADWKSGRVASSVVFSTPEGTNTEDLKSAVREFAQNHFGDRRYIFAVHAPDTEVDPKKVTPHPHVHLVVENISPGAEKALEIEPETLRTWRRDFSEIAKQHGINLANINKSRTKPAPHEKDMGMYQMLKRGEIPEKYKQHYAAAQERVKNKDFSLSDKEQAIIDRAKNAFIGRQRQIDDLSNLINTANNDKDKSEYKREIDYLKSINATIRMPMNNSQMMMKHAFEQSERKAGRGSKAFYSAPTVRHYMFADRLAKSHGVDLPPMAHASYKHLNDFISNYADKPTPKFKDLIKKVAVDRGLSVKKEVFASHKAAMAWFKENKDIPTVKVFNYVNSVAKRFNVEPPTNLNKESVKEFLDKYKNSVSPQMQSYAESIAKRTGTELSPNILKSKEDLAKWINDNKHTVPERSQSLKSMIEKTSPRKERDYTPGKEDEKNNLSPESRQYIRSLIKKGFDVSLDDVASDEAVHNLKQSFESKPESERWTKPLGGVDPAQAPNKDKSRDRRGPER